MTLKAKDIQAHFSQKSHPPIDSWYHAIYSHNNYLDIQIQRLDMTRIHKVIVTVRSLDSDGRDNGKLLCILG